MEKSKPVTLEQSADTARRVVLMNEFIKPLMDQVLAKCQEFGVGFSSTFYAGDEIGEDGVEYVRVNTSDYMPEDVRRPCILADIFLLHHHGYRAFPPDTLSPENLKAAITGAIAAANLPFGVAATVVPCDCPACTADRELVARYAAGYAQ